MNLHFAPKELFQQLEFDKIIHLLQSYCLGPLGLEALTDLPVHTDPYTIERLLQETFEYQQLTLVHNFPMASYEDLREDIRMLSIEGYVLTLDRITALARLIFLSQQILQFFEQRKDAPKLYANILNIIRQAQAQPSLLKDIRQVVDEEGELRPDASPELQRLVRLQLSKQQELDKRFRQMVLAYQAKGMLADSTETMRNGRRVLAVPVEYKRQVRGILHDESTSGKTVFIEPEEVIDLNNDIFDLEQEQKREIYRILRQLCAQLRPFVSDLQAYQQLVGRLDLIQAKVHLANQMRGNKPKLQTKPHIHLVDARHPLLLLKNQKTGQKTISFELKLDQQTRMLILSGPNAGGKSITMKTVGLLQVMMQAGLLIPAEEGTELGVFESIFADIGDQQSLDDELSTYSSRLRNAKSFLEQANAQSLVLIDEFGSGTDPKMGGAIAEAILRELNRQGCFAVITTHYSNLKHFAHENKGLVNGSMIFDTETLSPTYRLQVGKPGSSYAFEIAAKSGLPERIIQYAKRRVGDQEINYEELLIDLQREKQRTLEAQELLLSQQKQLDQLIKNYEYAQRELEFSRKKHKLQVKEQELLDMRKDQSELQKIMQELRQAENTKAAAERARALIKAYQAKQEALTEKVDDIKEELYQVYEQQASSLKIEQGCMVRLLDGGTTGTVQSLKQKTAVVEIGNMLLEIPLRDLQRVENPLNINKNPKMIQKDIVSKPLRFEERLDIRGMRYEDALQQLEEFLDNALLNNSMEVSIIHGRGTGALKKAVQTKLKEYRAAKTVWHPEQHHGGDGVTMVRFE